jgi:hypothetical protein
MPTIQGIVNPAGTKIRQQGAFTVVSKSATRLIIRVQGQNLMRAFVLATPWRNDGDIGPTGISASPDPQNTRRSATLFLRGRGNGELQMKCHPLLERKRHRRTVVGR